MQFLSKPLFDSEIKEAMFVIRKCKSPNIDGYTEKIFQMHLDVVGRNIIKGVQHFFSTGNILNSSPVKS